MLTPQSEPSQVTHDFVLSNQGEDPIQWSVTTGSHWLVADQNSGLIESTSATTVTVALNEEVAAGLEPGIHLTELTFQNLSFVEPDTVVEVSLNVLSSGVAALVEPPEGLLASGPVAGPFQNTTIPYTVTNTGTEPLQCQIVSTAPWIELSGDTSATLSSSESMYVTAGVNSLAAAVLAAGTYTGNVEFLDVGAGAVIDTRTITLEVSTSGGGDGWTQLSKSVDTRSVYVSSSLGDDANDGLTENTPKRTLQAARPLIRDGYPDWLLLRKGDEWSYAFERWETSGRSASEPQVLTSYGPGTTRPKLLTGDKAGIMSLQNYVTPPQTDLLSHIRVVGLHFECNGYSGWGDGPVGVRLLTWVKDFLVEDCKFEKYGTAVVIQGLSNKKHDDVRLRRNVIADCDSLDSNMKPQGVYAQEASNVLIEENLIDRVGLSNPSIFRHAIYVDSEGNQNFTVRGNIISNTSSHGIQLRPGGIIENNLIARTSIAITLGSYESYQPNSICRQNVILDGKNILPSKPRGWGITFDNAGPSLIQDNIVCNAPDASDGRPIEVNIIETSKSWGLLFVHNIVYGWPGAALNLQYKVDANQDMHLSGNMFRAKGSGLALELDDVNTVGEVTSQNNSFYSGAPSNQWIQVGGSADLVSVAGFKSMVNDTTSYSVASAGAGFPSPDDRTVAHYNETLGGTKSHDAFMAEARLQSRDYWRPQYTAQAVNDWVRAGFGQ